MRTLPKVAIANIDPFGIGRKILWVVFSIDMCPLTGSWRNNGHSRSQETSPLSEDNIPHRSSEQRRSSKKVR